MKDNNDKLLVGLLVVAVVVAVAGTWLNLSSLSNNFNLAGAAVETSINVFEPGGALQLDGTFIGDPTTLTGVDCSAHSGGNKATGETTDCVMNITALSNFSISFGSSVDVDIFGNVTNALENSTWEIGYCTESPAFVAGTNNASAAWLISQQGSGGTDLRYRFIEDADPGNYYTYTCEQAVAMGWNQTTGAFTNYLYWEFDADFA